MPRYSKLEWEFFCPIMNQDHLQHQACLSCVYIQEKWGIANILTVNWSRRESKCELFLMLLFIFCSKLRAADIVCAWVRFAAKDGLVRQAGGRRAGSWGLTRKDGARQIYSCGHPHPHPPNRQTFTSTLCCKCCQKRLTAAAAVLAHEKLYQCNQFQCTHLF